MPGPNEITAQLIALARQEDLGEGDITTALLSDPDSEAEFVLVVKQNGVLAGREIASQVLHAFDPKIRIEWTPECREGGELDQAPTTIARIRGSVRSVLGAERVLLNFLQRLCGVATLTRNFVHTVEGTDAKIYDTRKTIPGFRTLDKYAVRCGGGFNHRRGLFDAVLVKDNHLAGAVTERLGATLFEMLNRLDQLSRKPDFVEVEAASLEQMHELCKVVSIDVILLDNFSLDDLAQAVNYRDSLGLRGKIELEASGGVTLNTARAIAETGVERISVGAITHSAPALDLSLERL